MYGGPAALLSPADAVIKLRNDLNVPSKSGGINGTFASSGSSSGPTLSVTSSSDQSISTSISVPVPSSSTVSVTPSKSAPVSSTAKPGSPVGGSLPVSSTSVPPATSTSDITTTTSMAAESGKADAVPSTTSPLTSSSDQAPANSKTVKDSPTPSPSTSAPAKSVSSSSEKPATPPPPTTKPTSTSDRPATTSKSTVSSSDVVTSPSRSQVPSSSSSTVILKTDRPTTSSTTTFHTPLPTSSQSQSLQSQSSHSTTVAAQEPTAPIGNGGSVPNSQSNAQNTGGGFVSSHTSSVHVGSTLPKPVSITFTSDGHTITTAPSLVTSVFTSTESNGAGTQTFTSVFANPTTNKQSDDIGHSSFFEDKGAVAGVFISVILVILASLLGIFYCLRRRRRAQAIQNMIQPDNNLRFGLASPTMTQRTTYQARPRGDMGVIDIMRDDPQRHLMSPSIISAGSVAHGDVSPMHHSSDGLTSAGQAGIGALGLTGMRHSNSLRNIGFEYEGPFNDYHQGVPRRDARRFVQTENGAGIAIATNREHDPALPHSIPALTNRPPSPAPSTPSIYPPSLPPVPEKDEKDEGDLLFYQQETERRPVRPLPSPPLPPPPAIVNDSKPRNPFESPFDKYTDSVQEARPRPPRIRTNQGYKPLTPPESSSGHSPMSTTPTTSHSSDTDRSALKTPVSPFTNAFLGRPVMGKIEPLPRPKRNPLRLSANLEQQSSE